MLRIEKYLDDIKDERKLKDCFRSALCEVYFKQNKVDYEHIDVIIEWYFQQYKESIRLTKNEKAILESLPQEWKWIARDGEMDLVLHRDKPYRDEVVWISYSHLHFAPFNHLFQFIKWEDSEPYSIEELLKCEVCD